MLDDPAVAAAWGRKEGADIIVIAQIALQGQRNLPIPFADRNLGELVDSLRCHQRPDRGVLVRFPRDPQYHLDLKTGCGQ